MNTDEQKYTNAQILRKKAEELAKENENKIDSNVNESDINRLFHELQVHQIELEMQNEELRFEIELVEKALKKNAILFDLAPLGYFTLDTLGVIYEINPAGAKMLSDNRFSLINNNLKDFVAEKSKAVFNDFLNNVFKSNAKVSCQVMLERNKKPLCYVYIEGVVIADENKCLLLVIDISGSSSAHQFPIPTF